MAEREPRRTTFNTKSAIRSGHRHTRRELLCRGNGGEPDEGLILVPYKGEGWDKEWGDVRRVVRRELREAVYAKRRWGVSDRYTDGIERVASVPQRWENLIEGEQAREAMVF